MNEYEVVWIVNIYADSEIEAAIKALVMQRDPHNIATVFDVKKRCNCGEYHGFEYVKIDVTTNFLTMQ